MALLINCLRSGRVRFWVLLPTMALLCLIAAVAVAKGKAGHVKDIVSIIFGSADSPDVSELAEYVSMGMDYGDQQKNIHPSMADKGSSFWLKMHDEFGSLSGVGPHRAYGHWGMNQSIPREFLESLEKAKPGSAERAVQLWREFVITRREAVKQVLHLSGPNSDRVAQSISSMMNDVHVIGDYTTKQVAGLRTFDNVVNDYLKSVNRILGNHNGLSQVIRDEIKSQTLGLAGSDKAKKVLEILKSHNAELDRRLGNILARMGFDGTTHSIDYVKLRGLTSYQPTRMDIARYWSEYLMDGLKTSLAKSELVQVAGHIRDVYNGKVVQASEKLAAGAYKTFDRVYSPEMLTRIEGFKSTRQVVGVLQEVTLKDGSTTMVLSIPIENITKGLKVGISTGVATFALSEIATFYAYSRGELSQEDFCWESGKNCASGVLSGAATFVAVTLGAAPGGFVVLGIGVGSYMLCDVAFSHLRRAVDGPGFSLNDVLGILPTEIQRRKGLLDFEGFDSVMEYNGQISVMDYIGHGACFDYQGSNRSILEYVGNESIMDFLKE